MAWLVGFIFGLLCGWGSLGWLLVWLQKKGWLFMELKIDLKKKR